MASTVGSDRPPIAIIVLVVVAMAVVGLLVAQWFIGLVLGIVRLVLILAGFAAVGWLALVLLRKGR